ncbi:HepT-like ribonuclease domain-containing protein [Polycyclovorans algicola]|uniref:HepT-like ribonuclease domain-containing protein n=1 Tax=Polycyclovorans algicola TaxID=616992 RepID=UPI0004A747D6|nr:DUF86 domain-containing protein [Polycyclovorans algicola]
MSPRLLDYLQHMQEAGTLACTYVEGLDEAAFMADQRTQQAVILNLIILGEAATRLSSQHAAFVSRHPDVPWSSMKGMRNRLAHGYFDIAVDVVWETVMTALPDLLTKLPSVIRDAESELHD